MKQVDLIFLILFALALVSGGALMYLVISFKKLFPNRESKEEIPRPPQYEDYEQMFYNPEM
jgi:hypothetical protein